MRKPNILLVITDQMRSTALGCANVEAVQTPNLDRFAAQGVRFTNAVSNTPACTPARATFLTGKHVLSHGLVNNEMQLGHDHTSIAHALNEAGYRSGYIGKWHVDGVNRGAYIPAGPRRQGFDDYWAGTECNHRYMAGYYYNEETRKPVWFEGYEPDGQTDLALQFITSRSRHPEPFFLAVSWSPPHCPYDQVPDTHRDRYDPDDITFLPNAVDAKIQDPATKGKNAQPAAWAQEEHDRRKRRIIADYYAQVSALDECFGRLMTGLDDSGLAEDTIVVFTSDHGDMLFSHDRGWKGKPWRESVGIPLLFRWPGHIPIDAVSSAPIGLVDLMPTLLSLAGAGIPAQTEGSDQSEVVKGDKSAVVTSQFINFPAMPFFMRDSAWRGIVTSTHTYVETHRGPWLMFDDKNDPFQMHNLLESEGDSPTREDLAGELHDWLERTNDGFESAESIVERFCPEHDDRGIIPIPPLEPVILEGQNARYGK
jgi:arylsulfatase A-like enzyme